MILDGISNLLRYVEKMLGSGNPESASSAARDLSAEGKDSMFASNDYELSIAGVKGSEHGVIKILDVSALPSQPAAGEPVKITVHMQSQDRNKVCISEIRVKRSSADQAGYARRGPGL